MTFNFPRKDIPYSIFKMGDFLLIATKFSVNYGFCDNDLLLINLHKWCASLYLSPSVRYFAQILFADMQFVLSSSACIDIKSNIIFYIYIHTHTL